MAKYEIKDGVGIIPEGSTEIEMLGFRDCNELTSVVIPESVTKIGYSAFYGCSNLTDIVIPASVTEIGGFAFQGCSSLKSIVVAAENKIYDSRENCNAIIETATNKLIVGCDNSTIPESVLELGRQVFLDCKGLKSIKIPASVVKINSPFYGCTSLEQIIVAEGNNVYDSRNNCNAIIETEKNKIIAGCKNTVISDTVSVIAIDAFNGCKELTHVDFPQSVNEIGGMAFNGCSKLCDITIPETINKINLFAFKNCSGINRITVSPNNTKYDSRNDCNAIIETSSNKLITGCKNTIIPDSVVEIDQSAFEGCTGLDSIIIPESVMEIRSNAFENCSGLKMVSILGKLKIVKESTFAGCTSLETITLPAGIKTIENNAFKGCTSLKKINVPAKKSDYYRSRLPEHLQSLLVELAK